MTQTDDPSSPDVQTPGAAPPVRPLQYAHAASRRRGLTALAVGAVVVGAAGAVASAITIVAAVVPDGVDPMDSGMTRELAVWVIGQVAVLLSMMTMFAGGVAFLRRSPFVWQAAVIYVVMLLITSVSSGLTFMAALVASGTAMFDAHLMATLALYLSYAIFETFLLLLLTRKPVRSFIEGIASNDPRAADVG